MKTPQEIAADIYWTATDATTGPAIRALIVAGIEADRKQNPGPSFDDIANMIDEWYDYSDNVDLFIQRFEEKWAR